MDPIVVNIVVGVVCAAAAGAAAFFAGVNHRKKTAKFAIGSAEQEAKRIVGDAIKTAEAKKKEGGNRRRLRFFCRAIDIFKPRCYIYHK